MNIKGYSDFLDPIQSGKEKMKKVNRFTSGVTPSGATCVKAGLLVTRR
jgi:hypothetical protein